jgi:hypothetical protein
VGNKYYEVFCCCRWKLVGGIESSMWIREIIFIDVRSNLEDIEDPSIGVSKKWQEHKECMVIRWYNFKLVDLPSDEKIHIQNVDLLILSGGPCILKLISILYIVVDLLYDRTPKSKHFAFKLFLYRYFFRRKRWFSSILNRHYLETHRYDLL